MPKGKTTHPRNRPHGVTSEQERDLGVTPEQAGLGVPCLSYAQELSGAPHLDESVPNADHTKGIPPIEDLRSLNPEGHSRYVAQALGGILASLPTGRVMNWNPNNTLSPTLSRPQMSKCIQLAHDIADQAPSETSTAAMDQSPNPDPLLECIRRQNARPAREYAAQHLRTRPEREPSLPSDPLPTDTPHRSPTASLRTTRDRLTHPPNHTKHLQYFPTC